VWRSAGANDTGGRDSHELLTAWLVQASWEHPSGRSRTVRILLVEDQLTFSKMVRQGLEDEGFAVDAAMDGEEADVKARTTPYDVIILDQMLPKVDGLTLLKRWREAGITTHVLMLTAKGTTADKVAGLDTGADDYLAKGGQFDFEELCARLRALVRRGHQKKDPVIRVHDLTLDTAARSVSRGGKKIGLTPREYALLEFLAYHAGSVVTRTMIWDHLYDEYDENTSNVVDVYIRYLRNKVDKGHEVPLILTKWGEGYMLRGNEDLPDPAPAVAGKPDKVKKK
jgi:DNA-binding response OmpR family regulator